MRLRLILPIKTKNSKYLLRETKISRYIGYIIHAATKPFHKDLLKSLILRCRKNLKSLLNFKNRMLPIKLRISIRATNSIVNEITRKTLWGKDAVINFLLTIYIVGQSNDNH